MNPSSLELLPSRYVTLATENTTEKLGLPVLAAEYFYEQGHDTN